MTTLNIEQPSAGTPTLLERFDRSRLTTVLIFALAAAGFFWMVSHTPLMWDDFGYSLVRESNPPVHISDLAGLFSSCFDHYMMQNGRFANAPLCMVLEWIGKPTTDFITTGMFLLLGVLVYKLVDVPARRNSLFVLIFGLSFLLAPAFGQTMLWLCGSANYLWAVTAVAAFLLIFRKLWNGWAPGWATFAPVLLFSVIAGWMHEASSLGVCAGMFFYGLIHYKEITTKKLLLFAAFVAGTALCVFAPGTLIRAAHMTGSGTGSFIRTIVKAGFGFCVLLFGTPMVAALLGMLAFLFYKKRNEFFLALKRNQLLLLSVLWSLPLLAVFSREGRGTCGLFFLALACVLKIWLENIERSRAKFYERAAGLTALASIGVFVAVAPSLYENKRANEAFYAVCAKNDSEIVVFDELPQEETNFRYVLSWALEPLHNPFGWQSWAIARYYSVPRFGVFSSDFIDKIYKEDKFCVPANEILPGWYSEEGLDFWVRKEAPNREYADPVSFRYRIVREKLTSFQQASCLLLEKVGLLKDGGESAIAKFDAKPSRTIFTMEFPSGKYSFMPRQKQRCLIPIEETEIK